MTLFSFPRFLAILIKEFIQMRRDRVTFAMMIGIPVMQLLLFGYAINTDPRDLPTMVEMNDASPTARAVLAGMEVSEYFRFIGVVTGQDEGDRALRDGRANFVVVIPPDFERDILRGRAPSLLVTADASDPTAVGGAMGAMTSIVDAALADTLTGPLTAAAPGTPPARVVLHRQYNPEGATALNIVPGLLGIILAMTMVMITSVAMVREAERGTLEALIATPAHPLEVMLGKILPYVVVAYVQTGVFLVLASRLFQVPFTGDLTAFMAGFNLYVLANLALGFLISTLARSQMQAMQLSFFTILPTILLSGFMFPFAGMPGWAQNLGTALPATHFLRLTRKVMLKGGEMADVTQDLRAMAVILGVIVLVALLRYRQTLD